MGDLVCLDDRRPVEESTHFRCRNCGAHWRGPLEAPGHNHGVECPSCNGFWGFSIGDFDVAKGEWFWTCNCGGHHFVLILVDDRHYPRCLGCGLMHNPA